MSSVSRAPDKLGKLRRRGPVGRRDNGLVFERLAAGAEPVSQQPGAPAPAKHGYWAFPWPWFDAFWAFHQFDSYAPKSTTGDYTSLNQWIDQIGRGVVQLHRFVWTDDIYARIDHRGKLVRGNRDDAWCLHTVDSFEKALCRWLGPMGRFGWDSYDGNDPQIVRYAVDHGLEVFLPTRKGHKQKSSYTS